MVVSDDKKQKTESALESFFQVAAVIEHDDVADPMTTFFTAAEVRALAEHVRVQDAEIERLIERLAELASVFDNPEGDEAIELLNAVVRENAVVTLDDVKPPSSSASGRRLLVGADFRHTRRPENSVVSRDPPACTLDVDQIRRDHLAFDPLRHQGLKLAQTVVR